MEVWAHTLVKNEAKWLWYAVTSVIDHVDKVLLWDTGSTDNSLEIEKEIEKRYPAKVILKQRRQESVEDFTEVRQEMLNETKSDWFMVLDGDEIWYEESIQKVITELDQEAVVVPTLNLVGDIYHYQDKSTGRYKFGNLEGHYNLRFVKRNIPGLHSQGIHGIWGWADENNKMIQDRNTYKFINAPYLHATGIERSDRDVEVVKRRKKLKYEFGINFPKDFYYPEVFFKNRPNFVESPFRPMSNSFKIRAFIETPLRKLKRKLWQGSPGY